MRIKPVIAALCAAALAFTATSAPAYQAQSNTVAKERQSAHKKVCRWIERTGSHISERICLTAEQWRKVDEYIAREF